jgi:Mutator-like transposase
MMEPVGMMRIFKRSIKERGVKYSCYLGDGDTKTFKTISDAKIYPNLEIQKSVWAMFRRR